MSTIILIIRSCNQALVTVILTLFALDELFKNSLMRGEEKNREEKEMSPNCRGEEELGTKSREEGYLSPCSTPLLDQLFLYAFISIMAIYIYILLQRPETIFLL